MAEKSFEEKWQEVKASPTYQKLSPREQQDLARFYARKVGREQQGIKGSDPRMKSFLQENIGTKPTRPSTKSGFTEGLSEGFGQSAVGMAARRKLPEPGMGFLDAAGDLMGMHGDPRAPHQGVLTHLGNAAGNLFGDGAARGAMGAMGAMVGQAPDIALGAGAGALAARGLMSAGVKALPAAAAASVGTGAAIPGGAVKIAGGTNEQAGHAAALGAAGGLLPFAGKVPAGRLNPNVGDIAASAVARTAGPRMAGPVSAAPKGTRQWMGPLYETIDGYPVPPTLRSAPHPGAPKPPSVNLAQPIKRRTSAETGMVPTGPARSNIQVPPGGFPPSRRPTRQALEGQVGERPTRPEFVDALDPEVPPLPQRLALPPASAIQAGPAPVRGLEAFESQVGERPGTWRPRPVDALDPDVPPLPRTLALPPGDTIFGRPGPRDVGMERALYDQVGERPGSAPRPQASPAPGAFDPRAALDRDYYGPTEALDLLRSIPNPSNGVRRAIRAMEEDMAESPPARLPGRQEATPVRPTDAPAPDSAGGSFLRRLASEEHGTFDPKAALDALDASVGFVATKGKQAYGATKKGVQAAAKAVGPLGQSIAEFEVKPRQFAEAAATKVGAGKAGAMLAKGQEHLLNTRARTPYPTLNAVLNTPREFLFSDFGVPQAVKDAGREGQGFADALVRPTRELALDIDRRRTSAEAADLHFQASEPTYKGPLDPDAAAAKAESQRVSGELLRLQALDPTAHARWDGYYIGPREYAKHLLSPGAKPPMGVRSAESKTLSGYHGRGVEEVMSVATMQKRIAAGEPWVQQGPPIASGPNKGKVRAWRDYTVAERQSWGEVRHLPRSLDKMAAHAEAEARSAYLLDKLAQPGFGDHLGAFAEPAKNHFGKGQAPTPELVINGQRYIYLGKEAAKRGPVKKWGALADHYVREDVYPYLRNRHGDLKHYVDTINGFFLQPLWKKMMTIGNPPGYFINNAMHNNPMLEASGGSVFDLPAAATMLAEDAPLVQQLRAGGWLRSNALASELGARVQQAGLSSAAPHSGFSITKSISSAVEGWKAYEREAFAVAGATDDMYRVALVDGLMRREGKSFEEAARIADEAFYHPDTITAPAAQLASVVAPFARVFWYTSHALPNVAAKNPGKAAYLYATAALFPWLVNKMLGKDEATIEAEQQAMPQHMRGVGNSFPLGYDANGNPLYQDRSNWSPGGAYVENQNIGLPAPFNMKGLGLGGLPGIAAQAYFGKDLFTGRDLVEKDARGNVIEDGRLDFALRGVTPGAVRSARGIADAAMGKTTVNGNRVTVPTALGRAAGIKVNPVDVAEAQRKDGGRTRAALSEHQGQIIRRQKMITKAIQEGNEGAIPQLEEEIAHLLRKRDAMLESAAEVGQTLDGYEVPEGQEVP